jgi:hypothetical protein
LNKKEETRKIIPSHSSNKDYNKEVIRVAYQTAQQILKLTRFYPKQTILNQIDPNVPPPSQPPSAPPSQPPSTPSTPPSTPLSTSSSAHPSAHFSTRKDNLDSDRVSLSNVYTKSDSDYFEDTNPSTSIPSSTRKD